MPNDRKQKSKTREGSNGAWLEKARKCAKTYATKHTFVTSDNVLAVVGSPPGQTGLVGSIFRNGLFIKAGYTPSIRPSAHRREIGVWRLR